jgi:hypothetical protein
VALASCQVLLTAYPLGITASTHLKEASIGIKTAGIQDGLFPLVEAGYLGF